MIGKDTRLSGYMIEYALVAGFAICGATTNGLIGTHFIPSAHDHGMPETTAAGLLAVVVAACVAVGSTRGGVHGGGRCRGGSRVRRCDRRRRRRSRA